MDYNLTKSAEAMLCILYSEYLKRMKNGESDPKSFSGTDDVALYTKNKLTFEQTNECLESLARKGLICNDISSCGIMVYAAISDDAIAYMESKGQKAISEIFRSVLDWSPAIAECAACIAAFMQ